MSSAGLCENLHGRTTPLLLSLNSRMRWVTRYWSTRRGMWPYQSFQQYGWPGLDFLSGSSELNKGVVLLLECIWVSKLCWQIRERDIRETLDIKDSPSQAQDLTYDGLTIRRVQFWVKWAMKHNELCRYRRIISGTVVWRWLAWGEVDFLYQHVAKIFIPPGNLSVMCF